MHLEVVPPFVWFIALLTGVFNALSMVLWYKGLKNVNAANSAIFTSIMPLSAMLIAFMCLGESIDVWDIFGFACVLGAIICGTYQFRFKNKSAKTASPDRQYT